MGAPHAGRTALDPAGADGDADLAAADVSALATTLRDNPALRAKSEIALVGEVLGGSDWVRGPGDDGAVVPLGPAGAAVDAIACGEALLPDFVARDPFGAGLAAVVTNVNDLAAMGARPRGIVNTIVGERRVAGEILRGLRRGSEIYRVPLVGGHLTIRAGQPALSAFGLGWTSRPLASAHAAPGQRLIVACCVQGTMRPDFPFFASFDQRGDELADDIAVLAEIAASGACVAAKDVSMAGLVGSLAMMLEPRRLGVSVDLAAIPRPAGVPFAAWLTCFPAFAFLLCAPADRAEECIRAFTGRGLAARAVGELDETGVVRIRRATQTADVIDVRTHTVIGLPR